MHYSIVAETFDMMEKTTKRLELTDYLVKLFKSTPPELVDKVVYLMQGKLYPDYKGVELGIADKLAIRAISISSGLDIDKIEQMYRETGDIGSAGELALRSKMQTTLFSEDITVERVYATLEKIARLTGEGSQDMKLKYICSLLNDSTPNEARYILKIITGKLRLGIADYTVLDALAIAFTGEKENRVVLERAYNITSDLGLVARTITTEGLDAVRAIKIEIFKPIRPMLAERVSTAEEALERMRGRCAAEYKLDGERLQIHKSGDQVFLFSRRLENITSHYPDAIEAVKEFADVKDAIMEAEAVAINQDTGEYLPFQELMHRRRKYGIEEAMKEYPITLNFFDILYMNKRDCTQLPYTKRRKLLEGVIKADSRVRIVPMIIADNTKSIEEFMEQSIGDGCEGLMIKDLESNYRAGAREFAWIKLKREYRSEIADTLDLVIIGAFHGRGRRVGKYGAYLLAAYDKDEDMFRSICKVGTGFTDEDLANFYSMLKQYMIPHKHARVDSKLEADVWFEPSVVIEIIASEITLSPLHTCGMNAIREGSGLALRFPKFTGKIREEKSAEDATTVQEVINLYKGQLKAVKEETVISDER
ncbi:MAG: ATP-dependent DNA ligase [Nitrososphaerales archaeon]